MKPERYTVGVAAEHVDRRMFFALSKVGFALIAPSNFCLLLIGIGLVLVRWKRWQKLGRRMSIAGFVLLLILGFSPVGKWMLKPLEDRFAGRALPTESDVTHIVILGGFQMTSLTKWRGQMTVNSAAERLMVVPSLARRFPKAKVVFTGGYGSLVGEKINSVTAVRDYLVEEGVAPDRLVLEGRSLNTWQNATFTKALLEDAKTTCPCGFVLVTSAWHMPRSMGVFRKAGFEGADSRLYAWPVDFRTEGGVELWVPFRWIRDGLRITETAVKEWIGLLVYWLSDRSSSVWPKPRAADG